MLQACLKKISCFLGCFTVLLFFRVCFKEVTRSFRQVLMVFQDYFEGDSRKFQGPFRQVSGGFKRVSGMCQVFFMGISRMV